MTLPVALLAMSLLSGPAAADPLARIPFEFTGHYTFIDVELNGRTLSFAFDTGASSVVVDEAVARRLELEPTGSSPATGVVGTIQVPVVAGMPIELGGLRIGRTTAFVVPLDHLAARVGRPLDGIIGQDLLRGRLVLLDHDEQVIEVFARGAFPLDGWGQACPLKGSGQLQVESELLLLGGERVSGRLLVDSGAGVFVSLNSRFVRDHALSGRVGGTYLRKGGGVTGKTVYDRVGRIAGVRFCGQEFPAPGGPDLGAVPSLLSGSTAGVQAARGPAGLLGNAILRRYNLVFDLDRRRMYARPNRHRHAPILADTSGVLLIRRPDGAVVVDDVVAASPAADVGLTVGDEIRSVGECDVRDTDLEATQELLKQPGQKLAIGAIRDGVALDVVLETRKLWPPEPAAQE